MSQPLIEAAWAVREQFLPAETTVDLAAARTARLLATLLERRAATAVPIGAGASLIRKLSRSLSAQIDAREEFLMAHKLVAQLPDELGLDPAMYGDVVECPPDERRRANGAGETVIRLAAA